MVGLLDLLKKVRTSSSSNPEQRLGDLVALAEKQPQSAGAQTVAAYEAWLQDKHDLALRFATRADQLGSVPFLALLVLTALHASKDNDATTYAYAKRLASAKRPDKTATAIVRALAGSGILSSRSRSNERHHAYTVSLTFDNWVAWAKEFVDNYESRTDA
jgi:hypothetical protein